MIESYHLIKNTKIIDNPGSVARYADILIKNANGESKAHIEQVGRVTLPQNAKISVTDAHGAFACKGFVDLRAHLCAKGAKKDVPAILAAAKKGGYSLALICPDSDNEQTSVQNDSTRLEFLKRASSCDILSDILSAKCVGLYDDGSLDSASLRSVMRLCAQNGVTLFLKCEERSMCGGVMNEGERARQLNAPTISPLCEELALARYLLLAKDTGCTVHVHAISTKGSVAMLRQAKRDGIKVTADTCPQYYSLTEDQILFKGSVAKTDPPLRSLDDVNAVIEGLADNTIDAISTDHTPCDSMQKRKTIKDAPFGMIMLESALLIGITNLVEKGHLSIYRLVDAMCHAPMRILGIDQKNASGLNLFSITDETYASRSLFAAGYSNSAFEGWHFSGKFIKHVPCEW